MAGDRIEISSPVQLLVEGKDAENFFKELIRHLELSDVQVHNFGGVGEFRRYLGLFVVAPNFAIVRSIGVIRDAERSADGAFRSVHNALAHVNLPAPQVPMEPGDGNPSVRVLILPGDGQSGMLETLLCRTIAGEPVNRCIDDFLHCAKEASGQPVQRPDKARAHAWLATRPHPHVSVGVGAAKGYWNLDHPALEGVRRFLTDL